MTAFPEYTKRDVERACERGRASVEDMIAAFKDQIVSFQAEHTGSGSDLAVFNMLGRQTEQETSLCVITQLADRLSLGEVCILTPSEFDRIKPWLPVARIKQ